MDFPIQLILLLSLTDVSKCHSHGLSNLALGRDTKQSGTFGSLGSDLAVDGDKSEFSAGYCAHPRTESDPSLSLNTTAWWSVDLSPTTITPLCYYVCYVILYQRRDCCVDRTAPLDIKVGNTSDVNSHIKCGELLKEDVLGANVSCDYQYPVRFVSIHHRSSTSLGLCEVEVIGSLEMKCCSPGYYGNNCERECHCLNNEPCYKRDGTCRGGCTDGYVEIDCSKKLPDMTQPLKLLNRTHIMIAFSFEAALPPSSIAYYVVQKNGVDFSYPSSPGVVMFDRLYPNSLYTMQVIPVMYLTSGQPERGTPSNLLEVFTDVEPTTILVEPTTRRTTKITTWSTKVTTMSTKVTTSSTTSIPATVALSTSRSSVQEGPSIEAITITTPSPHTDHPPNDSSPPSVSDTVTSSPKGKEDTEFNTSIVYNTVIVGLLVIIIVLIIACFIIRRRSSKTYLTNMAQGLGDKRPVTSTAHLTQRGIPMEEDHGYEELSPTALW